MRSGETTDVEAPGPEDGADDVGWAAGLGRRAVVLTGDRFDDAKTAHGLLRTSPRFEVVAIIDVAHVGPARRIVPDGADVPVVASVADVPGGAEVAIVGVATYGGAIPDLVRTQVAAALDAGMDVVSGLHEPICDDPDLAALATRRGARVVELRAPRPFVEQRFWSGAVRAVTVPRVAVLGTDCDIGKRTTLTRLAELLRKRGVAVEIVATGQTGLLQGARQGFVLDATPLDFVSGALEQAIVEAASRRPDLILLQGQGSFRGPTGQVGPQLLVHTGVSHVILQHAPGRRTYKGTNGVPVAPLEGDIDLVRAYGAEVLAVALSAVELAPEADRAALTRDAEARTGAPAAWADEPSGQERLVEVVEAQLL